MSDLLKKERKGLIVIGDLPKKKKELIVMGDLSNWKKKVLQGWHDRAQTCIVPEMGGLKGALEKKMMARRQKRWGLKGTLKRMVEGSKAHSKEVRARRRTQKDGRGLEVHSKEVRARRRTKKKGEGSNAHSKGGEGSKTLSKEWSRAWRRTQKKVRARRHIKKRGEGSKAHSKKVRARRRTQNEVRARRRTRKEVGLGNTLP